MNDKLLKLAQAVMDWEEADEVVRSQGWGAIWHDSRIDDIWDVRHSLMVSLACDVLDQFKRKESKQ